VPVYKEDLGWECKVCGMYYKTESYALSCEKSHEYVYIKLKLSDLERLIQFIYTGDGLLVTPSLIDSLNKYRARIKGK